MTFRRLARVVMAGCSNEAAIFRTEMKCRSGASRKANISFQYYKLMYIAAQSVKRPTFTWASAAADIVLGKTSSRKPRKSISTLIPSRTSCGDCPLKPQVLIDTHSARLALTSAGASACWSRHITTAISASSALKCDDDITVSMSIR